MTQLDTPKQMALKPATPKVVVANKYDMRRLSYAGTFTNPLKVFAIRAIEWTTAKVKLLQMIRSFEKSGAPVGVTFWSKAVAHMGIRIDTPPEEIAQNGSGA